MVMLAGIPVRCISRTARLLYSSMYWMGVSFSAARTRNERRVNRRMERILYMVMNQTLLAKLLICGGTGFPFFFTYAQLFLEKCIVKRVHTLLRNSKFAFE